MSSGLSLCYTWRATGLQVWRRVYFTDTALLLAVGGGGHVQLGCVCLFNPVCQEAVQHCIMDSKPQGGDPTAL